MRHFSSYGPVDAEEHYAVPRTALVEECINQLVGAPGKGGHYFTIWAPRQSGKTWLMRRARAEIRARHGDRFAVVTLTLQGLMQEGDSKEVFLQNIPGRIQEALGVDLAPLRSFDEWRRLFLKQGGLFDRPVILLIDEFDSLTPSVIDELVALFRQVYLSREAYHLHSLALIGVRALLGVDSARGSPFNVQRSLHVPNLTETEVTELFQQYQSESGQIVEDAVVQAIYQTTRGQPGLVSWFGELLTEKYNRAAPGPIKLADWERVYDDACTIEPNNTILNLLKKARDPRYLSHVVGLFKASNVPFTFDDDWCNYLYLNGIITHDEVPGKSGRPIKVCRFSSPFVQQRLFNAFSRDMGRLVQWVPAVDPRQDLTATLQALDLPALLLHYRDYLRRAKQSGNNPWHGRPSRTDLHLREAVGHFHLYWWLTESCAGLYLITPEFPTGNGKVDLHIRYQDQAAVIEVKSFTSQAELPAQKAQAARYARSRDLFASTLALFVPSDDDELIAHLSGEQKIAVDGQDIRVHTVAIAAV